MKLARLRHSTAAKRDGSIGVRIYPGDDRFPENFRFSPQELRRFCWAVLADLDPTEAEIAQHEELLEHATRFAAQQLAPPEKRRA